MLSSAEEEGGQPDTGPGSTQGSQEKRGDLSPGAEPVQRPRGPGESGGESEGESVEEKEEGEQGGEGGEAGETGEAEEGAEAAEDEPEANVPNYLVALINDNGKRYYQVKWIGFDDEQASLEPADQVESDALFVGLLKNFRKASNQEPDDASDDSPLAAAAAVAAAAVTSGSVGNGQSDKKRGDRPAQGVVICQQGKSRGSLPWNTLLASRSSSTSAGAAAVAADKAAEEATEAADKLARTTRSSGLASATSRRRSSRPIRLSPTRSSSDFLFFALFARSRGTAGGLPQL